MKTEKGNKLIDDFMGLTQEDKGIVTTHKDPMGGKPILTEILGYHVSWDRLMPVVGKMQGVLQSLIKQYQKNGIKDALIRSKVIDHNIGLSSALRKADVDAVWKEIVEIIEFHNKTKK